MKKRFLFLVFNLILILSFVSAAQKIVVFSITLPISINKVIIDNNMISVLVESKNLNKVYIMFDIKASDGTTKRYFSSPKLLNAYEAIYFDMPLEVENPTYLYATPYHSSGSTITLYEFSKEIYAFSGSEYKTSTTITATAVTPGQSYATVTTTSNTNTNTDTKVLYVKGIQKIQDNNIEYLHNDYLGSTRRVSESVSGEQVLSSDYYYFGSPLKTYGYNNDYLSSEKKAFTFKEQDDKSGLYYFGARYYNSLIGRFLSVDPLYKPSKTPYNYANNNPLKFIDPDGKELVISRTLQNKAGISLYMYFGLLDYFPEFDKLRNQNPGGELYYMHDFEELSNYNNKDFEEKRMKSGGFTYPYLGTSYINTGLIAQDYLEGEFAIVELATMLHETIHLAEGTIERKYDPDSPEGIKETLENEIRVENRMREILNLDKTYEEQLKNKNSWVVKLVFSKEQYYYLDAENQIQIDAYKENLKEVEKEIIPFFTEDIKYKPFDPAEVWILRESTPPDHTAVYTPK